MYLRRPAWLDYARAAILVSVGMAIGLALPMLEPRPMPAPVVFAPLPVRAARAHLVYAPEVRHPVEVDAKEQDHLVKWLSKRLDIALKVPVLASEGFELLGGRLLPGPEGPVAQFMYQDASGKRLTLYVLAAAARATTSRRSASPARATCRSSTGSTAIAATRSPARWTSPPSRSSRARSTARSSPEGPAQSP